MLMERIKDPDGMPPREVETAFRVVPRESTVGAATA
jgi:hypothetical protein